jgi:phosphoserine phosphatase
MMKIKAHIVFDFDLTLVASESLADMMELGLIGSGIPPASRLAAFAAAADRVRMGRAGPAELALLLGAVRHLRRRDIPIYVERADTLFGSDVRRLFRALADEGISIHIVSSSYIEWIAPLAERWGVPRESVTANRFYWLGGRAFAARPSPLHREAGKCKVIGRWRARRKLDVPIIIVGDSNADYLPYKRGLVDGCVSADYCRPIPQAIEDSSVRRARRLEDVLPIVRSLLSTLSPP